MAVDARELKEYILENNYVEQILDAIHCHHIKFHGDYWTCGNPDGDNTGAIVIYNTENLSCTNYTRQMVETDRATDIIDLVCSVDISLTNFNIFKLSGISDSKS